MSKEVKPTAKRIQNTYLAMTLGTTLAASLIWGINTIFLLDAGLSNFQAFAANACFTLGLVLFEVPTGVLADTRGRRTSYMIGLVTLTLSTLFYMLQWQLHAPFWSWALSSLLLGLGFTFFSGALEAWLVDALTAVKFKGNLDDVFGKAQIVGGIATLIGSVAGGILAQVTNLGVPYALRAGLLLATLGITYVYMKDVGFTPQRTATPVKAVKDLLASSIDNGLKDKHVRWLMLSEPFWGGVGIYVFYSLQPYLLQLYGHSKAYSVAGLVAALVAIAQIVGGFTAPRIRRLFKRRTTALIYGFMSISVVLLFAGLVSNFWAVLVLIFMFGLLYAAIIPIRQSFLNSLVESKHRATLLSFDSLMGSAGGAVSQPLLGKAADAYGYAHSYVITSAIQFCALPFLIKARLSNAPTDTVKESK